MLIAVLVSLTKHTGINLVLRYRSGSGFFPTRFFSSFGC